MSNESNEPRFRRTPNAPTPLPTPEIKGSPLVPLAIVMVPLVLLTLYGFFSR